MLKSLLISSIALLAVATTARAEFPEKPIVVNGCQPAGGGNDRNLQALLPFVDEALGQPMIAQYRPGAGGTLAMRELAGATPDGHTLVVCDPGGSIFGPIAQNLSMQAHDFVPVARLAFIPWVLTVRTDAPYATAEELIEAARAAPGTIDAPVADIASADHYVWLRLTKETGLGAAAFRWVPHGGGAAKMRAILAGESQFDMLLPSLIRQPMAEGTLRPVAVASAERIAEFPDTPTFTELGIDMVEGLTITLFAPAGLPNDVRAKLESGLMSIKEKPEFQTVYANFGQNLDGFISGTDYQPEWEETWGQAADLLREVTQ